jgi:DDE superfamily endonuclease
VTRTGGRRGATGPAPTPSPHALHTDDITAEALGTAKWRLTGLPGSAEQASIGGSSAKESPPMPTPSLPRSLTDLLIAFGPCFTAPSFRTFQALVAGFLTQPGQRTVTGMLVGAGLAGRCHHDLAYRFFATAHWSADQLGLVLLDLIAAMLVPAGTPLLLATDDTLWRRSGPRLHGAAWHHDGAGPVATGPPGATAGWWSASSSGYRLSPGRCACRSWPGCGSPASQTAPRSSWPANWSTWPPAISATVPCTWSATPPTSASPCEACPRHGDRPAAQ